MKKTLLMMAAALTAWSASAQLYVTGASVKVGDQTQSWDAATALKCAEEGDYYTFQANGEFSMSTVLADWDDGWKTGTYTLNGGWTTTSTSATASLQRVDGNIPAAKAGEYVSYKVKKDLSTIEASFSSEEVKTNFRIHGQILNGSTWETAEMVEKNGKWEYEGDVVAGEFGIKECDPTGGQLVWIGGAATITEANKAYSFVEGTNSTNSLAGTYTIVYDPANQTITFKGEGGPGPEPHPVDTPDHLYVVGAIAGCVWNPATTPELTKAENVFSISDVELTGQANFSFLTSNGEDAWNALRYGAATDSQELEFVDNEATISLVSRTGDVGAIVAAPGKYDMTVTFTTEGVTLKVVKAGEVVVVEDLVLSGDFNSWAVNDRAFLMTRNGSTYTYSMDAIEANTMFKVKTAEDEWTTSWGAEGDPSWTEAQPVAVTPNVAMNAWPGSGCNFLVENALTNVTITFVKSDDAAVASTLTVQGQSAIETVEAAAAEAPAQYYNLQGIRVLAPEAGQLYIVNRAGKVSKEVAR